MNPVPFNPMQGEGRPQIDKKVIYLATLGINNTQIFGKDHVTWSSNDGVMIGRS